MLKKLLIANRGEIARRIIRTARKMGIKTVAVYSDADATSLHVRDADEAVHIGASLATDSYLRIDKIIAAAKATGADAIHPGYGFLSENADLPEACVKAGITFVGPRAEAMRALGGKAAAKDLAIKAGVPVVPGYQGRAQDLATLIKEAKRIGYPVMIKAVAGGGGRGMRLVEREADFAELFDSAKREATSSFGNPDVLVEKVVVKPRHIEVQVFGDTKGNVVHVFERDCTLQRRNQKVIEEAPAPGMSDALRAKMCDAAVKLAKSVNYEGAGTVEFLVEGGALTADAPWYFIEMNTRLQVEHPVTEEITGLDLVEWQLRVAAGEALPLKQSDIKMSGHAIEVRLCAEDPAKGFMPSIGRIAVFQHSDGRLETGVQAGDSISPHYDSMVAKVICYRPTRSAAIDTMWQATCGTWIGGIETNARFLANLLDHHAFRGSQIDTGFIARELDRLVMSEVRPDVLVMGIETHVLGLRTANQSDKALTAQPDPWAQSDAFSLSGPAPRQLRLTINGADRDTSIVWHPNRGSHPAMVSHVPSANLPGTETKKAQRRSSGNWLAETINGVTYVLEDGAQATISRPTYDASSADDAGDGSTIRAPITGRVAKLFATPGDVVEKGQRIAIVEAMKMEHVLTAATAGTIDKVPVAEGAQVTQGTVIAQLTAA